MKTKKLTPLLFAPVLICSCGVEIDEPFKDGHDPFSYNGNFENPELNIDGKDDEEAWTSEYATEFYTISYQSKAENNTDNKKYTADFKLYRGEKELCVFVRATDPNLLTVGNDNGSNVSLSDSVEIYLDTLLDGGEHPQGDDYQINLGIHSKTRVLVGNGSGWSSWTGLVQYESILNGSLNDESDIDEGYAIEMSIPYKQIGITRDSKIGVAFGLVDKYSSKTTNSKMWYGLTYKGNFANPQKPDTYFVYDKNTLSVPPVPTYDESKDEHDYKVGLATVEKGQTSNASHPEIDIATSRKGDEFTIRLDNKNATWGTNTAYWLYFDGGKYGKTTRDENSWCIRISPTGGISSFFYLGGPNKNKDVASKSKLTLMINERYIYLSYSLSTVNESFATTPVALGVATADLTTQAVMNTMTTEDGKSNMSNPATFLWLDTNGDVFKNEYNPKTDTATYNENVGTVNNNRIDAYRNGNILKIRVKNDSSDLMTTSGIAFYLDASSKESTARNADTWCLRINNKVIKDYFTLAPGDGNKAISNEGIDVQVSNDYVVVSLPLDGASSDYSNKDVGFTCSLFDRESIKTTSTMVCGEKKTSNTNPSTFVWIGSDNSLK